MVEDKEAKPGVCKGCGAEIQWIKWRGKWHPIEKMPKRGVAPIEDDITGRTIGWEKAMLFESHYAHCPKSEHFRGKREDKKEAAETKAPEDRGHHGSQGADRVVR